MRKEKLTMLYVFALALIIIAITPGCVRKRPPSISIETYEFHCRNLSDDELIAEFYRVDVGLQEALDNLRRWESELDTSEPQQDFSGFPSRSWYQKEMARSASRAGTAIGHALAGKKILRRVKELRKRKAIVLTIIYQRGLTLPVSVK